MPEADEERAEGHERHAGAVVGREAAAEDGEGERAGEDDDTAAEHLEHGRVRHGQPDVHEAHPQQVAGGGQRERPPGERATFVRVFVH